MKPRRAKKKTVRKPKTISHLKISRVSPSIRAYAPAYPDNPVNAVLQRLHNEGKLVLAIDERAWLADRIAELLAEELTTTSYGAAIIRRMNNWLKGWLREDVR